MGNTRAKDAASPYDPVSDAAMLDVRFWKRRLFLLATLTSVATGAITVMGGRVVWPQETVKAVTVRQAALEDTVASLRRRVESLESLANTNITLTCQVLRRVNPRGAIEDSNCIGR